LTLESEAQTHMFIKIKFSESKEDKDTFFCKLCKFPLITFLDFEKQENYGCCHNCFLEFAEARKKEWEQGWRPKRKEVDSYIRLRNKVTLKRR